MQHMYYKHIVLQKRDLEASQPTLAECLAQKTMKSLAVGCLHNNLIAMSRPCKPPPPPASVVKSTASASATVQHCPAPHTSDSMIPCF